MNNNYGFISHEVMRNPEISVYAKGLYGYLCSIATNNRINNFDTNVAMQEMKLSNDEYRQYENELIKHKIIYKKSANVINIGVVK